MREITIHGANALNKNIRIFATDEAGPGGASHRYRIEVRRDGPNGKPDGPLMQMLSIEFQKGAIGEVGVNGLSNEVMLALAIDRLEGFQRGPFACEDNAKALTLAKASLAALHHRTDTRVQQGVEGTNVPHVEQIDTAAAPTE